MKNSFRSLLIVATIMVSPNAVAELSRFASYGNCSVATETDEITDDKIHGLVCRDSTENASVSVICNESDAMRSLSVSEPLFHFEKLITVRYRFDKHNHVEEKWFWNGNQSAGHLIDNLAGDRFLHNMMSAARLVFQIGDERGAISLGGHVRDAIGDFKRRCQEFR